MKTPKQKCLWLWAAEDSAGGSKQILHLLRARYQLFKAGEDELTVSVENQIKRALLRNGWMPPNSMQITTRDQYRYIVDRMPVKNPYPLDIIE